MHRRVHNGEPSRAPAGEPSRVHIGDLPVSRRSTCGLCGYPLHAPASPRCPECGLPIEQAFIATGFAPMNSLVAFVFGAGITLGLMNLLRSLIELSPILLTLGAVWTAAWLVAGWLWLRRKRAALSVSPVGVAYGVRRKLELSIPASKIWHIEYSPIRRQINITHPDGRVTAIPKLWGCSHRVLSALNQCRYPPQPARVEES